METNWTEEQKKAFSLRDRNLLVSAAAGAGKTKVLVERIITMLTEDVPPLNVDQLLVVTFTNAAAAEMKERILAAIEEKLEKRPQDTHLSMQATLVNTARICTIDSFCESVIRDHFPVIDLDPGFRVAEETEIRLLQHETMTEFLEEKYEEGDASFLNFVSAYGKRSRDEAVEELILKVYSTARNNPDPEKWLLDCVKAYQAGTGEELEQSETGYEIRKRILEGIKTCRELIAQDEAIVREEPSLSKFEDLFRSDLSVLDQLTDAASAEEFRTLFIKPKKWKNKVSYSEDMPLDVYNQVVGIRERYKKILKDLEPYLAHPMEEVLDDLHTALPMVKELADLAWSFGQKFQEKKKEQNLIDFADMEQYALQILTRKQPDGNFTPSPVAAEYQAQFKEVLVDEYQDINLLQETILRSVSRMDKQENNLFMVGDVKQSIYGFRASRPDLFLDKYNHYSKDESSCQRVDLHQNFRSRPQVVDSVNAIFRQLMRRDLGGIEYDDDAALNFGADYGEPEEKNKDDYNTEVLVIDGKRDDELEARLIAGKIHELVGKLKIRDQETGRMRPAGYGDIVILLRSTTGLANKLEKVFAKEDIPVFAETKEGYFGANEVKLILSYLQVLDNRRQDIPLTAVLTSPIGGLTPEELAQIRTAQDAGPFYGAVEQYRQNGRSATIRAKLEKCLGQMDAFRDMVPHMPVHELIWKILDETGYSDFVAAMPGGEQRQANLEMLVEQAREYETTSYRGLFDFIRYMDKVQKQKIDLGEADTLDERAGVVQIMTIHKSKGLEFPIVFVAGMGRKLNSSSGDDNGAIVDHQFGIGLEIRDPVRHVKTEGLIRRLIRDQRKLDDLAEEMRLLYVAFTRAREKLILTGNLQNAEKAPEDMGYSLTYDRRSDAGTRWHWILPAILHCPDGTPITFKTVTEQGITEDKRQAKAAFALQGDALRHWDTDIIYDPAVKARLEEQFSYAYPYADAKNQKLKFTVSELKKRTHMQETMEDTPPEEELGEDLCEEPDVVPLIPKFMQKEQQGLTGADRGTAYHRVMELLDLTRTYGEDSLKAAIDGLADCGKISREMADCVCVRDLLDFLHTESGRRMCAAAGRGQLYREQPFVLGVKTGEIYPDMESEGDEITLVQGIIDVYFEEDDGLVVLDYKTDQVDAARELTEKYHAQVEYYAKALEQMLQKKVKEKIIYSFTLKEEIPLISISTKN